MPIALFNPDLVIARLAAQIPPPGLRRVAAAAELAAAAEDLKQVPAAYVVPSAERPGRNQLVSGVAQRNEVRFAVVLAVSNVRDARGANAQADLRTLRASVMTALLGWPPDDDFDPVEYAAGRLLQLSDAVLWWQDEFLTAHQLRYV